jgi:flagellar biosynthesis protein FlhG
MKRPQATAITSGKGGVGKTNLSVNLALALHRAGQKTGIFDADLSLANAHLVLGCRPERTIADTLAGSCTMAETVITSKQGVKMIAGGSGLAEVMGLSDDTRQKIIRGFSELSGDIDHLIVDTAAGVESNVIDFVAACDRVIVVVIGEPTAFVDAYASIKVLHQETGRERFDIIVNRAPSLAHGEQIFSRFRAITDKFLKVSLNHLGTVPDDDKLARAVNKCEPVLTAFPDSPSARAIMAIAERIRNTDPPMVDEGAIGFFRPMPDYIKPAAARG